MNIPNNGVFGSSDKGSKPAQSRAAGPANPAPNETMKGSRLGSDMPTGRQASQVERNRMIPMGHKGTRDAATGTPRTVDSDPQGDNGVGDLGRAR